MKKRPRFHPRMLLIILPLLPLILSGGVYLHEILSKDTPASLQQLFDALYGAMRIYSFEVLSPRVEYASIRDWAPENITVQYALLNLARFIVITVIALTVYRLLKTALVRLRAWAVSLSRHSYALHGDAVPVALLARELGMRAISADVPEKFGAANHILAFSDSKAMFAFLDAHYDRLLSRRHAHVFLCTNETIHSAHTDRRIVISDMAKNCARLYWKQHPLRRNERSVVIIGMGRCGSQLLTQALQVNVFLHEREIVYHVFGDDGAYAALHPQLAQVVCIGRRQAQRDSVFFHRAPWYEEQTLLAHADRVILCADEEAENLRAMDYLLEHRRCAALHVKVNRKSVLHAIWQCGDRVTPFGTASELFSIEQVTQAALNARAQLAHALYLQQNAPCQVKRPPVPGCPAAPRKGRASPAACLNCPHFRRNWDKLSAYKRSSCIAQDDHADVKIRELLGVDTADAALLAAKAHEAYQRLRKDAKRRYCEMEHRRWMRFLYMHGWQYGPQTNEEKRTHCLLRPFDELPPEIQAYDEDPYKALEEIGHYRAYCPNMIDNL